MEDDQEQGLTLILIAAVGAAVIGGSFQYGYNVAVVNAPALLIQEYFFSSDDSIDNGTSPESNVSNFLNSPANLAYQSTEPNTVEILNSSATVDVVEKIELTGYQTFLWSLTVSIYNVGGMIGSFLTGVFTRKFGRKGAMLANNVFSFIGAILMGTSKLADSLEMIMVARFLLGIFAGLATGVVPLFLTEISPKSLRGAIGVINQLLITIGILSAQILSLKELLGTAELWPLLLAFTAVPSIIQMLILPFLPESPRCLLIDRNKEIKAQKALAKFRGTKDVSKEIREMKLEAEAESSQEQMSVLEVFRDRTIRWQLISIIILHICQQLSGINAIFFYLNRIFDEAGVPADVQDYAAVGVGGVNVLMTVVSVLLIDRSGRKILLGGGFAVAGFFAILMTISLNLQSTVEWMPYLSIVSVIGFIVGFAVGPGPVVWILMTEFFRQSARPSATAIGCTFNWTFNFLLALVFPFMQEAMKAYVFLFFLAICIFASTYVFIVIPETKHKTFQEINAMFAKRNKLTKDGIEMDEEIQKMVDN